MYGVSIYIDTYTQTPTCHGYTSTAKETKIVGIPLVEAQPERNPGQRGASHVCPSQVDSEDNEDIDRQAITLRVMAAARSAPLHERPAIRFSIYGRTD